MRSSCDTRAAYLKRPWSPSGPWSLVRRASRSDSVREVRTMIEPEAPAGLSVWERDVYLLLVEHIAKESEVLGRYDEVMDGAAPHVRFLLELVAEDEARHHAVF